MHSLQCIFNTGAEPNLIREYDLEIYWLQMIQAVNMSLLRSATSHKVGIIRAVLFRRRKGDDCIQVIFGSVMILPV